MNMSCKVIQDLLPLYHDGVCSDESRALVDEHLKGCESCRKELDIISAALASPHIAPETNALSTLSSALKKAKSKAFAKGFSIAAAALLAVLIFCLMFSFQTMEGTSMEGLINNGDVCIVSKLAYLADQPAVGDIICVKLDYYGRAYYDIIRVIALPGDNVEIKDKTLLVNQKASPFYQIGTVEPLDMNEALTLGDNEYFVMGANQEFSIDSRSISYGLVTSEAIKGKVAFSFSPSNSPINEKRAAKAVD